MRSLHQFVAFTETVKHGSFAAAGRALGCDPSTLAKAVSRLESSLGVRLLFRTTRHISLTADGERLLRRCEHVLAEIEELHTDAAVTQADPTGTLRMDVPIVFGRKVVLPLLARLRSQHPQLEMDVRLQDGYADLVKDGIDIAVRIGTLRDSSLVARRFASQTLLLCGSPTYLDAHGTPATLDQLESHHAVLFRMPSTGRDRPWEFVQSGRPLRLQPQSQVRLSDGEAMVTAAVQGLGLVQVPDYMATEELQRGRLIEVLPKLRPRPMPISAVYPSQRLLPSRARVVVEALLALS